MFEKYFCAILKYIFHHPCCTVIKMDEELHLGNTTIVSTVNELIEKELIRFDITGNDRFVIKDKGLAYLEDKGIIALKIDIQKRKLERLRDSNERSDKNERQDINNSKTTLLEKLSWIAGTGGVLVAIATLLNEIFKKQ
jgi:hypothetical protein